MNTTYIDPQLNPQHLANTMHPPSNGHQTYVPAFENNAVPAMVPHQQVYFTPPRPSSQEHQPPNGPNEAILPYNNMDYNNPVTSSSPEFVPNNNDPAAATTTDLSDSIINNSTVPYQYQVQLPRPHQIDSPSTPSPRLLRPPSQQLIRWAQRPKFATSYWEEENTLCYQVDANGICVARRKDNDMINGTKLLNVTGISRGKRDGILKNEKARVVVKVGSMHFKGVWITFSRAKELANRFSITECLNPLLLDDPSSYFQNQQQNNGATAPSSVYLMPPNQSKVEPEQVPTHISSRPASPIMLEPCLPQQQNMTNPAASSSASTVLPTAAALITSPYFPPPASSSSSAGGSRNSSPFIKHHIYPSYDSTHSRNSSSSSLFSLGQQQAPMTNVYHNQQSLQNQSHLENNMAFIPPPPPPQQYNNINNMPQTNYVYSTPSTNSPAPSTPADPAATFHFENSSHNYYQQARTAHLQNNYQTASNDMSSYPTAEQHYHHYLH